MATLTPTNPNHFALPSGATVFPGLLPDPVDGPQGDSGLSLAQADALVMASPWGASVACYDWDDVMGHVYTLDDASCLYIADGRVERDDS